MRRRDDERGIALLLALLVLTLLVALILEFDAESRREYREAAAFRDTFKARMLTRAAVQAARAVLQQDFLRDRQLGVAFDGPLDLWAMPIKNYAIGDGVLTAQIEDEQGKLNLNDLAVNLGDDLQRRAKTFRFRRLFELLQIRPELVDAVIDWVDVDERPEPTGAESLYYQSQKPPYRAANLPLESLGDLRLVKGFTPEIVERLSRYVTVHPTTAGVPINLNTADPLVIQSLDPLITQTMAMEVVQGRPYRTKMDLGRIGSFNEIRSRLLGDIDVRSSYFSARMTITVNETSKNAVAVFQREPNRGDSSVMYLRLF